MGNSLRSWREKRFLRVSYTALSRACAVETAVWRNQYTGPAQLKLTNLIIFTFYSFILKMLTMAVSALDKAS